MRTLAEIDADIAQVKQALENVHGNEAEVYTRIVGYYRSVRNWNKGNAKNTGIVNFLCKTINVSQNT